MKTLNRVQLLGYLGNDPQVKENDKAIVATFPIATTERNADGEEVAEWHRVVAFGKLAEICRDHLKKGQPAFIEGRLKKSVWEEEGVRKHKTEVIAEEVILLGSRGETLSEISQDPADESSTPQEGPASGEASTPKQTGEPPAQERQIATIRNLAGQKGYKVAEIEKMVSEAKTHAMASKIIDRLIKGKK